MNQLCPFINYDSLGNAPWFSFTLFRNFRKYKIFLGHILFHIFYYTYYVSVTIYLKKSVFCSIFSLHSLSMGPIHYRISWETHGLLPRDPSGDHTKEVIGGGGFIIGTSKASNVITSSFVKTLLLGMVLNKKLILTIFG